MPVSHIKRRAKRMIRQAASQMDVHFRNASRVNSEMKRRGSELISCELNQTAEPGTCPGVCDLIRLFRIREVAATILLPASFVGLGAERLFLAVAVGLNAARADPGCGQGAFHRVRAPISESKVVFGRAALVAVALDN